MRKKLVVLAVIMITLMGIACGANYMYEKASVKGIGYKNVEMIVSTQESGWTLDRGWFIKEGDLLGISPGQATFNVSCAEGPLSLSFDLKILEGRLNTAINANNSNGYIIGFVNNTNGTLSTYLIKYILNNVTKRVDGQRVAFDPYAEHQIEIENNDGHIEVYVREIAQAPRGVVALVRSDAESKEDERMTIKRALTMPENYYYNASMPVIDYNDSNPLSSGRIAFQTINGTLARISNISIYCPFCWDEGVPDLGPIEFKRPNKTDLVNTTWGWVPANQVMVVVNDAVQNATFVADQLAKVLGGKLVGSFPYLNLFQIETNSTNTETLKDNLISSKNFRSIKLAFPNEQVYNEKSPLKNDIYNKSGQSYEIVGVQKAWDRIASTPLNHVHIGVTDDGLYPGYGEFNGKNVIINATGKNDTLKKPLTNFSNEGSHGTGVMNLLAADPDNGGLVGIASQPLRQKLKVTMVNIFPDGNAYITDCFEGLRTEIMSGCYIISCSWGDNNAHEDTAEAFEKFFRIIEEDPHGLKYLFVCSAGNGREDVVGSRRIPNGYPSGKNLTNMITVGNIMNDGSKAQSSNFVTRNNNFFEITLAAPGEESVWGYNLTDSPTCSYGGTSMAVPHVTAAAALIRAIDRSVTAEGIKDILVRNGNKTINGKPAPTELGGVILAIDKGVEEAIKKRCSLCQEDNEIPKVPTDFGIDKESIEKETNKPVTSPTAQGMPKVESFAFTPNPVCIGEDTKLTWTTSNATGATIRPKVGEVEASGFRIITPEQTMTYSMRAWNSQGNGEDKRVMLIVEPCLEEGTSPQTHNEYVVYDFIDKAYDEAQWEAGPPDVIFRLGERSEDDSRGSAEWKYDSLLSDMSIPNRVLQVSPPQKGYTAGIYRRMNYLVDPSDHLTGKIGFINGSSAGNATFRISIIQGNLEKNLLLRPLTYREGMVPFDIPLGEYAGWQPAFSFRVEANGPSTQDKAVWQNIKITGSSQRTAITGTVTSGSNFAAGFMSNIFKNPGNDLETSSSIEDWLNR